VTKSDEICFFPLETKKKKLFLLKFSKSRGAFPHSDAHGW